MARHRLAWWGRRKAVRSASSGARRVRSNRPPHHEEWSEQIKLAALLDRWLDPTCSYWTATDPVAGDAVSGAGRKLRGVKPGVPDVIVWYRGRTIAIELKSRQGVCSPAQRMAREGLLRAGVEWWECRSTNAVMWALAESGVKFREIVNDDGTVERWQQPQLADWEVPRADPTERRPTHPEVRAARRRWRERRRERNATLAAERRIETDFPTSLTGDTERPGAADAHRINTAQCGDDGSAHHDNV
jgi:hypothetical protein